MKKKSIIIGLMLLTAAFLFSQKTEVIKQNTEIAQEANNALEEVGQELEEEMHEMRNKLNKEDLNIPELNFDIDISSSESNKAYMGVYSENMDFNKARELHYNKMYGILITGIVPNSAAHYYRLRSDDILMEINGEKVLNSKKFSSILSSYFAGEKIDLKIFRNGKEITIPFILGTKNQTITSSGKVIMEKKNSTDKKKKLSVGYGGGSWIPVWFMPDFTDVNAIITNVGFSELRDNGIFLNGGGGKGFVGKGWFLGGMGAGYSIDRKKGMILNQNQPDEISVTRRMQFSIGYGGVTLDKRLAISKNIITSLGFMLGWGNTELQIAQTDGNYDWNSIGND